MPAERKPLLRCAIYTRKSSDEGLEQSFNSLDAQREACVSYIYSQRHEGWRVLNTHYDDGGYSGGTLERPALSQLLKDIAAQAVDVVVVYKVDRLTRALSDFAKIVEIFDAHKVPFVSVTQHFNTTTSMGRLTLNVLLSFAQFEREVTGERIRDKIAASKKKGMWMGGCVPLGYDLKDRKLLINPAEAKVVRRIFQRYAALGCVTKLKHELDSASIVSKIRTNKTGWRYGGKPYSRGALYAILHSRHYLGEITHRGQSYNGEHQAIVPKTLWETVQAKLLLHGPRRRPGGKTQEPSLLAGLLYDDQGHRLTPTHTVKHGKRYRYYLSQAVIKGQPREVGQARRVPAEELEALVLQRLHTLLISTQEILDALVRPKEDIAIQKALMTVAKERLARWDKMTPTEVHAWLQATVSRITIRENALEILVSKPGLRATLLGRGTTPAPEQKHTADQKNKNNTLRLTVATHLKRCGGEVRLIIPAGSGATPPLRPNAPLIKAIARAHHWHEQLMSGEVRSLTFLAKELGVTDRYVSRILRCAFLAPDIVEAILEGRQPPGFTLDKLRANVPIDWEEQRRVLGFSELSDKS